MKDCGWIASRCAACRAVPPLSWSRRTSLGLKHLRLFLSFLTRRRWGRQERPGAGGGTRPRRARRAQRQDPQRLGDQRRTRAAEQAALGATPTELQPPTHDHEGLLGRNLLA